MTLNRKSLLYRLITIYGGYDSWLYGRLTLCSLCRRAILGGLLIVLIVLVGVFFLGVTVVAPLLYFLASIETGVWWYEDSIIMTSAGLWVGLLIIGFVRVLTAPPPGLFSFLYDRHYLPDAFQEVYKAWKEKYCPTIEIK